MKLDEMHEIALRIYAELLVNIRQITVVASLPSTSSDKTAVKLSPDRCSLHVFHEGQECSIQLPGGVREDVASPLPLARTKTISLRLPLAEPTGNSNGDDTAIGAVAPWSAASLTESTRIFCRYCKALLVKESVCTWKDLPSENWAEMMDFWHCHKPDTEETLADHHNGFGKGYGFSNVIGPEAGVGLSDVTAFLLTDADCNIATSTDRDPQSKVRTLFRTCFSVSHM